MVLHLGLADFILVDCLVDVLILLFLPFLPLLVIVTIGYIIIGVILEFKGDRHLLVVDLQVVVS